MTVSLSSSWEDNAQEIELSHENSGQPETELKPDETGESEERSIDKKD